MGVRNAARLPALQALFEEFGVRPTYVVTWEMATRPESVAVLRDLARSGRCEIGTHLHPWSSPPFRPEDLAAHTYPHNLPVDLLDRQLRELTAAIEENLGVRPTTYRAGATASTGARCPSSSGSATRWTRASIRSSTSGRKGGMIFDGAPTLPVSPDYDDVRRPGASKILEIPIHLGHTARPAQGAGARVRAAQADPLARRVQAPGAAPVWLRPPTPRCPTWSPSRIGWVARERRA
jgi:peptidoglycan/xylan/chitin deacetylase (PgdA/CDA1 family)